jgi:hypothetical protein
MVDPARTQADRQQLPPRDHPVLSRGQRLNGIETLHRNV